MTAELFIIVGGPGIKAGDLGPRLKSKHAIQRG